MQELENLLNSIIILNVKKTAQGYKLDNMSESELDSFLDKTYKDTYVEQYNILSKEFGLDKNKNYTQQEINSIKNDLLTLKSKIEAQITRKIKINRK